MTLEIETLIEDTTEGKTDSSGLKRLAGSRRDG
jgi:hypothetical protein